jgi:hypothetical protein
MKKYILVILIALTSQQAFAQNSFAKRVPASKKAIPALVLDVFAEAYPDVLVKGWYVTHITYWYSDVSSGWYSDWYAKAPDVVFVYEQPNFFEVEFIQDPGELSRAIYNKYGYWYETRTQIKGLPEKVVEALKNSQYGAWKRSALVEKIDSNEWPEAVYRFKVSKGMKAMILKMNANGDFVQEMSPE